MRKLNSTLSVVVVTLVSAIVLSLVNIVTGPIIAANGASAQFAPLLAVMPEAENFELLYDADNTNGLVDVADTIVAIYKETSGKGFAVKVSTTKGFTHDPIEFTVGISNEGTIVGTSLTNYPETRDFGADYPSTYIGADSTLASVSLVAGVTYSSSAFKGGVEDAFAALVANDLMKAAEKSAEQLLTELVPTVCSGATNPSGIAQVEAKDVNGLTVYFATNNSAAYAIVEDGDKVLGVVNCAGSVDVYDVEGNNVTDAHPSVVETMKNVGLKNRAEADQKKLVKIFEGEYTALDLAGVHNIVSSGFTVKSGKDTYYAFAAKPYGFSNGTMTVLYILDSNGAIVKMHCGEFIIEAEYYSSYTLDEDAYKASFVGVTADSFNSDMTLISGATVTSDAIRSATNAVFEAFELVK